MIARRWRKIRPWAIYAIAWYGFWWWGPDNKEWGFHWPLMVILLVASQIVSFIFLSTLIRKMLPTDPVWKFPALMAYLLVTVMLLHFLYVYAMALGFVLAMSIVSTDRDDDDEFKKWLAGNTEAVRRAVAAMTAVWGPAAGSRI